MPLELARSSQGTRQHYVVVNVTNPDDKIDFWAFWDDAAAPETGHLVIEEPFWVWDGSQWQTDADGGDAPANQWVAVTDAQYKGGKVDFLGGDGTDDWIFALASDGGMWSNMTAVHAGQDSTATISALPSDLDLVLV